MSRFNFIISQFGLQNVRVQKYEPGQELEINDTLGKVSNQPAVNIPAEAYSYFGTPIIGALTLVDPDNENNRLFLDTVLMEVSQSKNIVTTSINGRNGTIKEYVSDGDYQVSVKGVLVNNEDGYNPPMDAFQSLLQLCAIPKALKVESPFLQLFDIYNLVIQDKSFPQSEGVQNTQAFDLSCLSDEPIELLL